MIDTSAKIPLTGGADFWLTTAIPEADLPQLMMTDGPHGVRKQLGAADHVGLADSEPATCFPPAVGLASSWNPALLDEVGVALGEECRAMGVGILLGPGMNIKRNPRCGRNFEYFSEDPLVSAEMASALVRGIQSQGVGTSVKHFAVNNQETDRMRRDSQVDERTLREIYLRGFGKVIASAKPWTVMCSYNRVNGTHASQNHWLLTEVLRDEWGYEGVVVSDWGAVWDRVAALKAGLDLEMPANALHEQGVRDALAAGEIDEATIDRAYGRIEKVIRRALAGQVDAPDRFDADAHHQLARRAAEQCIVLLGNDGVLPLAKQTKVAVVGEFARTPRYQGAGSSRVNPTRLVGALEAINALVGHEVPFAPGFVTAPGQQLAPDAHDRAVAVAREADVVLVFLGLGDNHEAEGYDREHADLPAEQLRLLDDILAVNPNVVVVLSNGSSVLVPFADRVRAVVEGWLLGQAGGPALADVLYGEVNPSGKIAETIPHRLADVPSHLHFPGDEAGVRYGEGLFVGYRGYDASETAVAFPFGHGLSYTTFSYSNLDLAATGDEVRVGLRVANTGQRAGREVVQVYVSLPDSKVLRVPRELKGFTSVTLEPGASQQVEIVIPNEELAYWSVVDHAWVVEEGRYIVEVGASSRDQRLSGTIVLSGNEPFRPVTLETTAEQAEVVPGMVDALRTLLDGIFPEDDPDWDKAQAAMPLASLIGFSGRSGQPIQELIDAYNAGRR